MRRTGETKSQMHERDRHGAISTVLGASISRSQILKALAAGLAVAAVPEVAGAQAATSGPASSSFPYFPQVSSGTYTPESVPEILGNIATLKMFDASLGAFSLGNQALLTRLGVAGPLLTVFQAILAKDEYQVDWLLSLVPRVAPVTTTFTVDPALA